MQPLLPDDPQSIGPYKLRGRLGAGGMGEVYLALSTGGRPVAVKVARPEFGADPEFRRRFAGEIEAAQRVGGFFTAHIVAADTEADRPWFASAYVPGPSLHSAVREHGPLSGEALLRLGAGMAEGLTAVHECQLVHRDLKPSNVLLCEDGPRLIDFGIARAMEATLETKSGTIVGTPAYMSPEQARGDRVGPAGDVFSLAGVLLFAATGTPPFGTGQPSAVLYRIVHEAPDLSSAPEQLRELLAACLEKDPDDRPGVDEVLAACAVRDWTGEGWLPSPILAMAERARDSGGEGTEGGDTGEAGAAAGGAGPQASPANGVPAQAGPGSGSVVGGNGAVTQGGRKSWWRRFMDTLVGDVGDGHIGRPGGSAPVGAAPGAGDPFTEHIEAGWCGAPWGASVQEFRERFSKAYEQHGWWLTGEPPEPFCGVRMHTQYSIGENGLSMVAFYPEAEDREMLVPAVVNALGAPKGQDIAWDVGDVEVSVKVGGIAVALTHKSFRA